MSHGSTHLSEPLHSPQTRHLPQARPRGAGSALRSLATFVALGSTCALAATTVLAATAAAAVPAPAPVAAASATPIAIAAAANIGLFGTQDPTFDGVYRQSLAILGLEATGHTPNAPAVAWLLAQQCADGSFTAYRANTSVACTPTTEDENATAAAISALVALGKPTTTAVAALKHFQLADGGFYDNTAFGPAASDANSTGLALSALVAAGVDPATVTSTTGKTGDTYLRSVQIACDATTGGGAYDFQGEATLHANDLATVQALLGELGKAFPVSPAAATGSTPACPATVIDATTSAAAATSYLTARLAATKGAIPSAFGSGTDWTTTANAVLDLEAAGAGTTAVAPALAALEAAAKTYVKTAGVNTPGPLATLLLLAHASGVDPGAFGGVDLTTTLASTERVAAPAPPAAAPTPSPSPVTTPVATLPTTGASDPIPLGAVGTLLVGLGIAALLVSRRRGAQHGR
jgi:LPXTG-motif cell wall-anchored protein